VADTDNQVIRKISTAGVVTTIGGTGSLGSADGIGTAASFYNPKDVAVDAAGVLYIVDRANHTLRKGTPQSAAASVPVCTLTATPASVSAGASATLVASCSPVATSYVWTGGTCAGVSVAVHRQRATTAYTVAGVNAAGTGASASAGVTVSGASATFADADRVFLWAERTYAQYFSPGQPPDHHRLPLPRLCQRPLSGRQRPGRPTCTTRGL
jgi:hypothetical protein